jgi:hypothetical protein
LIANTFKSSFSLFKMEKHHLPIFIFAMFFILMLSSSVSAVSLGGSCGYQDLGAPYCGLNLDCENFQCVEATDDPLDFSFYGECYVDADCPEYPSQTCSVFGSCEDYFDPDVVQEWVQDGYCNSDIDCSDCSSLELQLGLCVQERCFQGSCILDTSINTFADVYGDAFGVSCFNGGQSSCQNNQECSNGLCIPVSGVNDLCGIGTSGNEVAVCDEGLTCTEKYSLGHCEKPTFCLFGCGDSDGEGFLDKVSNILWLVAGIIVLLIVLRVVGWL